MNKTIAFHKMVASGNDFILIDQRPTRNAIKGSPAESVSSHAGRPGSGYRGFAKKYCDRRFGIGADGVLVVEPSKKADFKMRIFNADGSQAQMCGNGARCAALYMAQKKRLKTLRFETLAGIIEAQVRGNNVKIKLTDPKDIMLDFPMDIYGRKIRASFINTGVPHAVIFVEKVDTIDVAAIGRTVRNHELFAPAGTNVDFVQVTGPRSIKLRTYERGVEAETPACGTGSTAAAIINFLRFSDPAKPRNPIKVLTAGGETLRVSFDMSASRVTDVWLEGKAGLVFTGCIKS
jgi:diaminopimelate epimerase